VNIFKHRFTLQVLALAAIILGLWIAHFFVIRVVQDRLQHRSVAEQSVLASHPGDQVLVGPILEIKYEEAYTEEKIETIDRVTNRILAPQTCINSLYVLPTKSVQKADLAHTSRRRGIYVVNAYSAQT
jgi:inner membrane protein involved in colicin E2 resistance